MRRNDIVCDYCGEEMKKCYVSLHGTGKFKNWFGTEDRVDLCPNCWWGLKEVVKNKEFSNLKPEGE